MRVSNLETSLNVYRVYDAIISMLNAYIKKYRKGYADEFGLIPTQLFESNQSLKSYGL